MTEKDSPDDNVKVFQDEGDGGEMSFEFTLEGIGLIKEIFLGNSIYPMMNYEGLQPQSLYNPVFFSPFIFENYHMHSHPFSSDNCVFPYEVNYPFFPNQLLVSNLKGIFQEDENTSPNRSHEKPEKRYIKKPLNAFMIFIRENRTEIMSNCDIKESTYINQILGSKWRSLDPELKKKYYEVSRKEKELHSQMYPNWSARENYALHSKKARRKMSSQPSFECHAAKKCRAKHGLKGIRRWCEQCRAKRKCDRTTTEEVKKRENDFFL